MADFKILIACEYSGITRDAFIRAGFDATSCDLIESEKPGKHYKGDVFEIINDGWDMMIAHPPCTYLSFAGTKYWNESDRMYKRLNALEFFAKLIDAPINHICIENPMGIADSVIRKHDQIIHPYFFGDDSMKRTCLWLKNLPKLIHNKDNSLFNDFEKTHCEKPKPIYIEKTGKVRYFTEAKHSGHIRSKTFSGIAQAMANQWGKYLINKYKI